MDEKMSSSYLTTMVGKEVRAYKGGPEAWHGLLIAVKPDFITLFNEKDGFIYYKTQHIKSVVVDSKSNGIHTINQSNNDSENEGSFQEMLENLIGETVKINRGGPGSKKGTLLAVSDDYLAIQTEKEGVIYYNLEHIKSVSAKIEEVEESNEETDDENEAEDNGDQEESGVSFIGADSLDQLFNQMKYTFVIINHGPESVEGVLVDTEGSLLTLVAREEVLRVNKFHVKSIRQKIKSEENNENSNQSNNVSIVSAKKKQQDRRKRR